MYPLAVLLTLYNTLVLPYFNYCILSWGSKIKENSQLYLWQKKAVRIITHSNYIAHTEPLCKQYGIIKLTDVFSLAIWKFYYTLMNNQLLTYFSQMKPVLPKICTRYEVRNPMFHLPDIRHSFWEQSIGYCLIVCLFVCFDHLPIVPSYAAELVQSCCTHNVHTQTFS